jgi:hypothetical protein
MTTLEIVAADSRYKQRKKKIIEKLGKSMKNISSIDCVGVRLQSAMTYTYIGGRT